MAKKAHGEGLAPLDTAPLGLGDRKASELVIIRWVARKIDDRDPDPNDCPDPFAWTLLRQCREIPGFVADCFLPLWAKLIPSRSQLDQQPSRALDGQAQLDLIDRIEQIRDEAIAGKRRQAEPQEEPVSAFEEFTQEEDE